jgi:2-phosphosulfolactate phosphatase
VPPQARCNRNLFPVIYNQEEFDIRCEWGLKGIQELAPVSDVIIIVDILSFSTCVDIATANGAVVYPYRWKDGTAVEFAKSVRAELADHQRSSKGYTLSPASLSRIPAHTRIVLPSPNGSTLSLSAGHTATLCGCLRNALAVANYAQLIGKKIAVIPAGEQWDHGELRPGFEDLAGAGMIISYLHGSLSPESKAALSVFQYAAGNLEKEIRNCSSGKELAERGFEKDISLACAMNVSDSVPKLIEGRYCGMSSQ